MKNVILALTLTTAVLGSALSASHAEVAPANKSTASQENLDFSWWWPTGYVPLIVL
ncbi:hypothetical protein ACFOLL_06420 [Falsochrobactrum ovis]|uniref:Uncharacterized protein n=1 Tax=Falsochrobactrum ovis TaxID=1293442 RepID=A0A364K035_9HYPH|nr:hypothetical protein [Falsochrobactrum ovis]RAK34181.1 hypothetical protein C7374_101515 [Falsochrobactrum ovis]